MTVLSVEDLHPHPALANLFPAKSDEEQVALTEDIKAKRRIDQPVQVDESCFGIVDGLHRWKAAQEAGIKTVPVLLRSFSSDQAVREAALTATVTARTLTAFSRAELGVRILWERESERARARKSRTKRDMGNFPGAETGNVREIIAKRVGLKDPGLVDDARYLMSVITQQERDELRRGDLSVYAALQRHPRAGRGEAPGQPKDPGQPTPLPADRTESSGLAGQVKAKVKGTSDDEEADGGTVARDVPSRGCILAGPTRAAISEAPYTVTTSWKTVFGEVKLRMVLHRAKDFALVQDWLKTADEALDKFARALREWCVRDE